MIWYNYYNIVYIDIHVYLCTYIIIYIYSIYICMWETPKLIVWEWKADRNHTVETTESDHGLEQVQMWHTTLAAAWIGFVMQGLNPLGKSDSDIYIYIVMWYWKWWELHKMLDLGISINHKTNLNIPRWSEIMRWDPAKALVRGNSTGYPSTFASPLKRWVDAFSAVAEWQGLMIIDINSS